MNFWSLPITQKSIYNSTCRENFHKNQAAYGGWPETKKKMFVFTKQLILFTRIGD